jgi:hypothetical protein
LRLIGGESLAKVFLGRQQNQALPTKAKLRRGEPAASTREPSVQSDFWGFRGRGKVEAQETGPVHSND